MKSLGRFFAAGALIVLAACSSKSPTPSATPKPATASPIPPNLDLKGEASQVVDDLAAGQFNSVEAKFDATMTAGLSVDALAANWIQYQKDNGGYRSHGTPKQSMLGAITVEQVPITTATGSGEVRVSFHADGTIAGLYSLKAGASPAP